MYLKRFSVKNIRTISEASMEFASGTEAGWHVILGANGAGKTSLVRAFALMMMGEKEAYAARQTFSEWMTQGAKHSSIEGQVSMDADYDTLTGGGQPPKRTISLQVTMERADATQQQQPMIKFSGRTAMQSVWGNGNGWFCASFGPLRSFTGGDNNYDSLFLSNKRLAPHLTALGEGVALTEALSWLMTLFYQAISMENGSPLPHSRFADEILKNVSGLLNNNQFFPNKERITGFSGNSISLTEPNGMTIALNQLSGGYRSALSMVVELIRQMCELYGYEMMSQSIGPNSIAAPGVVFIDEVDCHLHPTWQRDIGRWLTRCFPNVQFIVTTHSPIVCRTVAGDDGVLRGSVWRLPAPGEASNFHRIEGDEFNELVFGDVMDAYATNLFGSDVLRSTASAVKLERLAELNTNALNGQLAPGDEAERRALRRLFPAHAGSLQR